MKQRKRVLTGLEIERLKELRDNAQKVQAGLDYVEEFLTALRERLIDIDQTPEELKALPEDQQRDILTARQEIIRAMCVEVRVYADGHIEIDGALDGGEAAQFGLGTDCRSCSLRSGRPTPSSAHSDLPR